MSDFAGRRSRLSRRALPLAAVGAVALTGGLIVGAAHESASERAARAFASAWERGDFAAMHGLLTDGVRSRWTADALRRLYTGAADTATATRVAGGKPHASGDRVRLPVAIDTRVFGRLRGDLLLPMSGDRIAWQPHLVFPGLRPGEALTRRSSPPRRGRLLARRGEVLARGPATARSSPLAVAGSIAGRLEPQSEPAARRSLYADGFPAGWPVGVTGLERAFELEVRGRPGGELLAGARPLARAAPVAARTVRTTIDVRLQQAATVALAGRFGGVAAMDARTGEIRALAGIAFSAPQPPGSTFKIITAAAALEAGLVKPGTAFPVRTSAVIDGVELKNAHEELCGGTFRQSFARSCNSVFAPLGVRVGAARLVRTAERFGFNAPPSVPGEAPSTVPAAEAIASPLELGATAIGQGRVLATPLKLASVAQAVGAGGVLTEPRLRARAGRARRVRVVPARVARTLRRLMRDVVGYGTGRAAAIPGVAVAGKTGTAELEDTRGPNAGEDQESPTSGQDDPANTDAWFTAFAPAGRPRIAVAVMLVRAGAGGDVAAPAARVVLQSALGG